MDVRYFAEPITMLPQSSNLHGSNLVKGLTPYPVFLPAIVEALLEAYRITSGVERLRRRGADIQGNIRDEGTGSHGDWGLVPVSLRLVVVAAPQSVALDSAGQETEIFSDFTASHPAGLQISWSHGNVLLEALSDTDFSNAWTHAYIDLLKQECRRIRRASFRELCERALSGHGF